MIIKKIAPPKKSNDPKSGIPILINYIANPTSETKLEKCVYFNARNFHVKPSNVNNNLFYSHQMLGMACECPRSKYPFAHYVFSWRESENPSIEQIEEAIDIFCEFNGYEKCQMLYGLHDDTKNTHLHLLVNRVKEEIDENLEYKYSCVHKFQDLMLCQKAVAKINAIQGWDTNNVNFKYSYDATSDSITERPENKRGQGKKLPTDIVDKEHSTGIKSAMRIAREQITDIILKATSWDNLHQELLSNGFAYKSRGQGAVIKQRVNGNDIYVKASSIHKDFTIKKLEVKFGKKFESAGIPKEGVFLKNKEENPTEETKKLFEDSFDSYKSDRQKYVYNKKIILDELKIEYETKITKIKDDRKKEMDSLFASSWTGRGKELNEKRSEISARYKKLLEDVQNEYKRKRDDIKKQFKTTKNLHNIKNYVTGSPLFSCSGKIWQESYVTPKPCIFFDFKYKKIGHDIIYYNKLFPDVISFVDTGKRIVFYSDSEAEIKTGLSLAKKKWKTVFYSGNQTYAEMCERIGAKQNITVLRRKIFDEDILKPEAQRQRKKIFIWEEEADIDYEQTKPLISGFISSGRFVKPYPVPMFGFKSRKDGIFILYFMGNRNDSPSFKDAGSRIYIFGSSEDEILAGLKLAQFKWGSFSLFGSLDFQKQAASIAIKNGLNFVLDDSLAETDFSRWVKNEFPSYF
ncbi:MAG: relaxase/mobilization nuclease domain-containing protein, partial [Deltaproteobacteria bacterium]|nr:relaxase/mobilization nuclease domain-containing protein [Deltaproteobacteria bacterium]